MSHYYEIEGKKLPSVTQIIGDCTDKGDALTQWGANMVVEWIRQNCGDGWQEDSFVILKEDLDKARFHFKEVSQTALDVGSEVHAAIENYLKTKQYYKALTGQAEQAFIAFLQWSDEHKLTPIALEQTVYGNGWAGTLDIKCMLDGKQTIVDFKSSAAHYPETHGPQIAAYRSVVPGTEASGVLRLDKNTGVPDYKDYSNRHEKDLNIFNKMVELYFARHPKIRKAAQWTNS